MDVGGLKNLILSGEQYRAHPFARGKERTHVFELANGEKKLIVFGSPHINDPDDPLFDEIVKRFQETKPDIVYVEGMGPITNRKNEAREEVQKTTLKKAKQGGESQYTLKLGVDAGTDFESPEPAFSQELLYLLEKGFSKKDIFIFYIYRDIHQYLRNNKTKSAEGCKKYLKPYLKIFRKASRWNRKGIEETWREILEELDVENGEFYKTRADPIPWEGKPQTTINETARASSNFRDRHILERIAKGLKKYNKLFIVYGSAHAVMLEPALRALMENIPQREKSHAR